MRVALVLVALAAAAALAIPARSASTAPQLTSFSVSSVGRTTSRGLTLRVAGSIDCTKKAGFHVWLWITQTSTGALAHSLVPASLPPNPTQKQLTAYERNSTCTGASKSWVSKLKAEGTHPAAFAKGQARACAVITVSHSDRYLLRQSCSRVTVS